MWTPLTPRASRALALVFGLLVAACGGGDGDSGDAVTAPATVPPAPMTAASGPPSTPPAADATTVTMPPTAPPAPPDLASAEVVLEEIGRFEEPVDIDVRAGDAATIYVTEKPGRLVAVSDEGAPRVVLDISALTRSEGERGHLGTAFSPDGSRVYVDYTSRDDGATHVDELSVTADGAVDPASRREILRVAQPYANHNGGDVRFGPDGMLYISLGDGGSGGDPERRGLDLSTPLGKLLRIDPTPSGDQPYTVPADNPFVSVAGARPEIWSYGLRNAWRVAFDRETGDLWVADVGQDRLEEVDVALVGADGYAGRGTNFGWSAWEGSERFNDDQPAAGALAPVYEYEHGDLGCSITGGTVYRGTRIPALRGAYLFGDYCAGGVRALPTSGGTVTGEMVTLDTGPSAVVAFGEDADGELLVASIDGGVYRIEPA